jgi:sugar phosphate isomerase/epimerase
MRIAAIGSIPYGNVATRAWTFRTVGYGHSPYVWADIISQLIINGYDYVLSIEHEDPINVHALVATLPYGCISVRPYIFTFS